MSERRRSGESTSSASVQDYVKVIYSHSEWQPEPITTTTLAHRLGVAPSSVSEMIRRLDALGLVSYEPYQPIQLTDDGIALALSMVRRHRILETYLVDQLGYGWDEVHDEAELLEHTVSDRLLERMSARLGHPKRDPHGDPIPDANGVVLRPPALPLEAFDAGHPVRVARISDNNPELLRWLHSSHIDLDTPLVLQGRRPFSSSMQVALSGASGESVDLGEEAIAALWVVDDGGHDGCSVVARGRKV